MSWTRPRLGLKRRKLQPCPGKPNCVCSEYEGAVAYVAPIVFMGEPDAAWQRLQSVIGKLSRAKVIETAADYVRAEFTSRILRFVDDVEFRLDRQSGVIQVRSASRIGYSDMGVNRRRVEEIRALFEKDAAH
jgi:uncharacterized protein (DUF1499 family)